MEKNVKLLCQDCGDDNLRGGETCEKCDAILCYECSEYYAPDYDPKIYITAYCHANRKHDTDNKCNPSENKLKEIESKKITKIEFSYDNIKCECGKIIFLSSEKSIMAHHLYAVRQYIMNCERCTKEYIFHIELTCNKKKFY